jgi:hypothetical protein
MADDPSITFWHGVPRREIPRDCTTAGKVGIGCQW